mgnify:CR=1 FL=1
MTDNSARYVKLDDWFFEIKMVRAIKVDEYGKPYNVISNCTVNGDTLYIDGLLGKDEADFTRKDFVTFYKFCQRLGVKKAVYDRFVNGELIKKEVLIEPQDFYQQKAELEEPIVEAFS